MTRLGRLFNVRIIVGIVTLLCLVACDTPVQMSPLMRADLQDLGFAEPALARSIDALQGQSGNGSGDPAGRKNVNHRSDGETLGGVDFRIRDLHEISLGLAMPLLQHRDRKVRLRILAGRGRTEVLLPNGVDILVEPISVIAKTKFIEAVMGFEQPLKWPRFLADRVSVTAEVGHRRTWSEVSIRSPLIRRDDAGMDDQLFLGTGLRVAIGPVRAADLDVGVRYTKNTMPIARLGLEHRF